MKKSLRRFVAAFLVLLVIILAVARFFTDRLVKRALPDYAEQLEIPGVNQAVTVFTDSIGVPHIEANNSHDLYFVTGYIMARERLWQIDLLRRVTYGRLSEIFGAEYIETDQLLRSLRFEKKSQQILANSSKQEIACMQAYSEGINYYINKNKEALPLEFTLLSYTPEAWEPVHSLNLIGYMGWDLKSGWSELFLNEVSQLLDSVHLSELYPKDNQLKPALFDQGKNIGETLLAQSKLPQLGTEILHGSNNWVVNAQKTGTGFPLLANDMHLGFGIPGIWYQIHQIIPDSLNVTGVALPGAPVIVVGHNDSIAWGMTNTYVKNIDFYEETLHPDDSLKYKYNGAWKELEMDTLEIFVKGQEEPEVRVNYFTHHGPVVSEFKEVKDKTLTMKWVGDIESNEFRSVFLVNRAQNWNDFTDAFKGFQSISQNVNYADKKGNIGLIAAAGVPIRKSPEMLIFPGDTSLYEWEGTVPQDELPAIFNPEKNFIVTANNLTTPGDYPYYIGSWHSLPYRYRRITEMIAGDSILDARDFMRIHTDSKNLHAQDMVSDFLTVWKNAQYTDQAYDQYVQMFEEWDCNMNKESIAATVYNRFSYELMYNIMADELGAEGFKRMIEAGGPYKHALYNFMQNKNSVWYNDVNTEDVNETYESIALKAFTAAVDSLKKQLGTDTERWRWGYVHTLTLEHPLSVVDALNKLFGLNRGPYPMDGHKFTVTNYAFDIAGKRPVVDHGASQRHIYDLSDWDKSYTVIPTGNSGLPGSRNYCNQTELYVNGKYHKDHFSKEAYTANAYATALYK